jgi:signal transduction histidine kinase
VIEGVLWLFDRQVREKNIVVERRIEYRQKFPAFPGELRQVISNLVANAIQAIRPNGRLCVRVHEGVRHSSRERGVFLVVSDSGSGISRENRGFIFEPFFSTKGENGTGLGLWVTKGIVEKHRGTIRVRSRQGETRQGTTFSVFLPFQQTQSTHTQPLLSSSIDALA